MSGLNTNRLDLLTTLGAFLGWPRDSSKWNENQQADGDRILNTGLRQIYTPPVLPGEKSSHMWTFLRPIAILSTVPGQGDLQLPEDFGGLTGQINFTGSNVGNTWLDKVSVQSLLNRRQALQGNTGVPCRYAISALKTDGSSPQIWQLMLDPTPDDVFQLQVQYRSDPYDLSPTTPFPMGGQAFADALDASVIAAADELMNDNYMGALWARFIDRLRAAVSHDRQENVAGNLGYNSDPGMGIVEYAARRDNGFTINGEGMEAGSFYFDT